MARRLIDSVTEQQRLDFYDAWIREFGLMTFVRANKAVPFCVSRNLLGLGDAGSLGVTVISNQYLRRLESKSTDRYWLCHAKVGPTNVYLLRDRSATGA